MDDPWGSPWTSSDHSNGFGDGNANGTTTNGLNGRGDDTPKPPQPAVLAGGLSGNTPFASLPEASPWADDDDGQSGFGGFDDDNAFGDWATATADTNTSLGGGGLSTPGTSGWGGFAGEDFENGFGTSGSNTHLSPRKDSKTAYGGLGQLSPIAWPSSAALSPGGSPGGSPRRRRALSRQSSVNSLGSAKGIGAIGRSRSPSIDPWSSVPAQANEKHDDTDQNQKLDYMRTRASSTLSIPVLRLDESNASKPDENEAKSAEKTIDEAPKDVAVPQIVAEHVDSEDGTDSDKEENDETPKPPPQPTFPPITSSSSRPSSSGSDGSRSTNRHADIDDPIQDSPTTSVEDDATTHAADGSTAATDADISNADTDTGTTSTPRPHVVQRKSSSKVQGLVELYDGLSTRRAAVRSVSASSSARDSSRHGSIVSDRSIDTSEIGEDNEAEPTPKAALFVETPIKTETEFPTSDLSKETSQDDTEDGTENNDNDESSDESSEDDSKEATPAAKEDTTYEPPHTPKVANDSKDETKALPAPDTDILSASGLLALYGKQTYSVDQTKIDELYNDKDVKVRPQPKKAKDDEHSSTKPHLDAFIPDYILDDSFTTISERKVWYRIARHGSYRKHAAGGDDNDNYRPVTWRTSRIRDDTVKIVRRWMEEDSFTGKPTLGGGFGRGLGGGAGGGGGRSGNLFGWDSAAEPVALDEVFKKKRPAGAPPGAGHKYNLSATSSAWANEGSGASAGVSSPAGFSGEFSPGFSPAPVFGWGSGGGNHSHDKAESARNSIQFERPAPPPQPVAAPSPVVAVPSPTVSQPSRFSVVLPPRDIAPTLPPSTEKEDSGAFADGDDDDDWGEMISSPVKEEFSIPPMTAMPLPPAPVEAVPAFVPAAAPAPVPVKPSIPALTPSPPPPPQLDDKAVASLADSIIRGLPDLSYMAA